MITPFQSGQVRENASGRIISYGYPVMAMMYAVLMNLRFLQILIRL